MGIEREFGECRGGDSGGGVAVAVRWSTTLLSTFARVPADNNIIVFYPQQKDNRRVLQELVTDTSEPPAYSPGKLKNIIE